MPVCEICGEEVNKVTKCNSCGDKFCEDCGSEDGKVCIYCEEDEDAKAQDEHEDDEDDDW